MDVHPTRAPRLARGLVAFVLALFALGWFADRAHVAFESHSFCAEHQRVEHCGKVAAHDHVLGQPGDLPGLGASIHAPEGAPEEHDVCCVLLARGGDPIPVPRAFAASLAVPIATTAVHAIPWGTAPRGSIPLLALAPKQSPPTA
ncbi:MAG: hypothetical protein NTY35_12720 [Planctomycetota bacterium]|nr:hypothetical protein [Planctomycetota bacterium]